jgi:hypothetical protein
MVTLVAQLLQLHSHGCQEIFKVVLDLAFLRQFSAGIFQSNLEFPSLRR